MEAEKVVQISPLIRRITAGNGSVFTGPGTNTYLVGNEEVTVIDPWTCYARSYRCHFSCL